MDLPKEGQAYYYYDDGKPYNSRKYLYKVVSVIPKEKYIIELFDKWKKYVNDCGWLYSDNTDYFVEAEPVEDFDMPFLVFVRTKYDDGWFSFNNGYWDGRLDVDNSITEQLNFYNNGIRIK